MLENQLKMKQIIGISNEMKFAETRSGELVMCPEAPIDWNNNKTQIVSEERGFPSLTFKSKYFDSK